MTTVPNHLGVILDGNRRWARERGLPAFEGHRRGLKKVKVIGQKEKLPSFIFKFLIFFHYEIFDEHRGDVCW